VLVLSLLAGWLGRSALRAPWLGVSRVAVSGNVRLSTGEVQALLDGLRGQSILSVDLERYRRRLMDSPWVAAATLWRHLPSTIEVRIVERVPMTIARLGDQLYLVDASGVIIDGYTADYRDFDLPIVDGLLPLPSRAGAPVDAERLRLTADLVTALGTRPDLRKRLSQIDVSAAHDAMVMFDNEAAWLHLGDRDFLERLRRYLELAPTLKERFHDLDYVDLRFDQRVFVRARPATGRHVSG
jgi:cell division septal protein FtsQ